MRVLVGIKDTTHGIQALESTVERAKQTGDQLTVAIYAADGSLDETVSAVRDRIQTLGVDCTIERVESDPGSRLVELATLHRRVRPDCALGRAPKPAGENQA